MLKSLVFDYPNWKGAGAGVDTFAFIMGEGTSAGDTGADPGAGDTGAAPGADD